MILIYTPSPKEVDAYLALFRALDPSREYVSLPEVKDVTAVEWIITWGPPEDFFAQFTQLKGVFALGAGVDKLVSRQDLAASTPIYRLLDAGMSAQMIEYVRYGVLEHLRYFDIYKEQQKQGIWKSYPPLRPHQVHVGVLGLGVLGEKVAQALASDGFNVKAWSRTLKEIDTLTCVSGSTGFFDLISQSDVIVCILPSTEQTYHLFNAHTLSHVKAGARIINLGRGTLIDETALLNVLDSGHLRHAQLDVFDKEPLDIKHPFWSHPKVSLTPHIAAITLRKDACVQILEKLAALKQGLAIEGCVDRQQQY